MMMRNVNGHVVIVNRENEKTASAVGEIFQILSSVLQTVRVRFCRAQSRMNWKMDKHGTLGETWV